MKFDTYTLKARITPAIIVSVPFFILHYFLLSPALGKFWSQVIGMKVTTDITFTLALFFLLMHLNRIVSKEVFERIMYDGGLNFPTTKILLHKNTAFSEQYKKKVHEKIFSDFKIRIFSQKEESKNENRSRQCIVETMSHIRRKVGKGILLGQHNEEYGFIRNLTGGSLVALIMSILNILTFLYIYPDRLALIVSGSAGGIYLFLTICSFWMIDSVGRSYAKILIQEYMAI